MRKKITILAILLMIGLTGCGLHNDLPGRFDQIVYFNGINEFEAKTIAEMRLTNSSFKSFYKNTPTVIRQDDYALKYPQYHFVDFSLQILVDVPSYLVVIDKTSGDIIFANEYFPRKIENLDWVVERFQKYGKVEKAPNYISLPEKPYSR